MTLKTFAQQDLESRHDGKPVRDILIAELERLKGKPYMMAQMSVALMISEPTLRKWCVDLDIDIQDYQAHQ